MQTRRPLDWLNYCIPAGSLFGVRIGIHWTFPLLLIFEATSAGREYNARWGWVVAIAIVALFLIVLMHEFGHVLAARREGAPCDRVMLWPLGGLAFIGEERLGPPEARIAAAGPAVNLAFVLLLVPVLALGGLGIGLSLLNPFDWYPLPVQGQATFVQEVLWAVYKMNLVVLLFNLIPAFPMDGGRILRGLLHPRLGAVRSILAVTTVAFVFFTAMLVVAIVYGKLILGLIAVFFGAQAWMTRRQAMRMLLQGGPEESGFLGYDFSMGHTSLERDAARGPSREERQREKEQKRREKEAEEEKRVEAEVDRLLEKIHRDGIRSLTRRERSFLEQASRRKR